MSGDVVALDSRRKPGTGGWRVSGGGPIRDAYEMNGALWRPCGCGAECGQACIGPTGTVRRVPCLARLKGSRPHSEGGTGAHSRSTVSLSSVRSSPGATVAGGETTDKAATR